jgi:hypothetical protein
MEDANNYMRTEVSDIHTEMRVHAIQKKLGNITIKDRLIYTITKNSLLEKISTLNPEKRIKNNI